MHKKMIGYIFLLLFWITCQPVLAATLFPGIALTQHASGLTSPIHLNHAGDGSGRLFVIEQRGRIRILNNGVLLGSPFLDISDRVSCCGERGLLSMAFPPNFTSKNYFYVYYTDLSGNIQISRFLVTDQNPDVADAFSEENILTINHPIFSNHNGGQLAFGPDGFLYIGTGDGGGGGDPLGNAQNPDALLGKILRIDVESGVTPYSIPADNPFVETFGFRPEIWAIGLRNPWRFSFDRLSGDLYIGDVGQSDFEEVDFQPVSSAGGENYGWNIMEGAQCYNNPACDTTGLVLPIAEYDHTKGCSITGGMVYRGIVQPGLQGTYFYGDYCSGRIWGARKNGMVWQNSLLIDTALSISSFGEDEAGEIYVADYSTGIIYKITALDNDPLPDVKVNGTDELLSVTSTDPVNFTLALDPGSLSGEVNDWWIVLFTPFGDYWLGPSGWVLAESPVSTGQIPLFDLPPLSLLETPLPPGVYLFLFILDNDTNGLLDQARWFDYVLINVI
jgi:glucose/arabinose dehydrogenase